MQKSIQTIILPAIVLAIALGSTGWTHLATKTDSPIGTGLCRHREPDPPPPPPRPSFEAWFEVPTGQAPTGSRGLARKEPPDPPMPKPKPKPKRDEARLA